MYNYKAKCIKVVDGDTLDLEVDLGFNVTITERFRLARVNTPEVRGKDREEGLKAKAFVLDRMYPEWYAGGSVDLYVTTHKNKGKYGRWIAEIVYDHNGKLQNLSDILIKEGLAEEVNYD